MVDRDCHRHKKIIYAHRQSRGSIYLIITANAGMRTDLDDTVKGFGRPSGRGIFRDFRGLRLSADADISAFYFYPCQKSEFNEIYGTSVTDLLFPFAIIIIFDL